MKSTEFVEYGGCIVRWWRYGIDFKIWLGWTLVSEVWDRTVLL